jgi:hypothetical protein
MALEIVANSLIERVHANGQQHRECGDFQPAPTSMHHHREFMPPRGTSRVLVTVSLAVLLLPPGERMPLEGLAHTLERLFGEAP